MSGTRQQGFGITAIFAIILVVTLAGVGAWFVWHKNHPAKTAESNKQKSTSTNETEEAEAAASSWMKPSEFIEYSNSELGFTFAFPEKWGPLTEKKLHNTIALGKEVKEDFFEGQLSIAVEPENNFQIVAEKYGATVQPKKAGDLYKWTVTSVNPADEDHKVGDEYHVTSVMSAGGVRVYDFSWGDEGYTTSRWVFITKGKVITISQPSVGPYYTTAQPESDKASKQKVAEDIVASIKLK